MIIFYTVLFGILTALVTFLSSTGGILDNTRQGMDRITLKGVWICLLLIAALVVAILQQVWIAADQKQKEHDSQVDKDHRDSIVRNHYDSVTNEAERAYDSSTKDIITSLAQYGLKYDTAQKRIEKLVKDSSRTTIVKGPLPELDLCLPPLLIDSSSDFLKVQPSLCCTKSACIIAGSKTYLIGQNRQFGYEYLGYYDIIPANETLSADRINNFPGIKLDRHAGYILFYIAIECEYTDIEKTKALKLNAVAIVDPTNGQIGFAPKYRRDMIRATLKKSGIIFK